MLSRNMQAELELQDRIFVPGSRKRNFEPVPEVKFRKKGGAPILRRHKRYYLLGKTGTRASAGTLGVPPARTPKTDFSRSRKQHIQRAFRVDVAHAFESLVYRACMVQQRKDPEISVSDVGCRSKNVFEAPVNQEDQYDFLNCELMKNESGTLSPHGIIPRTNQYGVLPCRLAHTFTYLFKRGFYIERPGTLPFFLKKKCGFFLFVL